MLALLNFGSLSEMCLYCKNKMEEVSAYNFPQCCLIKCKCH